MTYIASKDPNNAERQRLQEYTERWDAECPEWDVLSVDPEQRRYVSEDDVQDAEVPVIRRYGTGHVMTVSPGANDPEPTRFLHYSFGYTVFRN